MGSYFAGGINPLRLRVEEKYVRSAPGGTGYAKTGGNYSASLLPIAQAQKEGYDNIIWLDACKRKYVEEMGAMNIMFVYADKVVTAPAGDTILRGVTRESVGTLLGDLDIKWVRGASGHRPGDRRLPQRQAEGGVRLRHRRGGHARGRHPLQGRGSHHRRGPARVR